MSGQSDSFQSKRTTVKRLSSRARYDRESVYSIVDAHFVCHVGFIDRGSPFVIPTVYGRRGEQILIHGAQASRMLNAAVREDTVTIAITLIDGLVLARSAVHHSANYRSVMIIGKGSQIEEHEEKSEALRCISENVLRGRWKDVRPPSDDELSRTKVVAVEILEASAKVRDGGPIDDECDLQLPIWAGVVPLSLKPDSPLPDDYVTDGITVPHYIHSLCASE